MAMMKIVTAGDTRARTPGDWQAVTSFVDALPWPAIVLDASGLIATVNTAMRRSSTAHRSAEGRALAEEFPEYAAALQGNPAWLTPQDVDIEREGEHGIVRERIIVRPIPGGACLLVEDLTRMRQLEEADAQTARLASMGFMLAGACHEISNPLTAVYSMLQLLQASSQAQSPELQKGLAHIGRDVQRLLEITQRLSGFSRAGDASRRVFAIDEAVEESMLLLRQSGQLDGIDVVHESHAQAMVDGSIGQLREVFHNIALNAIQAMEGSGRLLVRTSLAEGEVRVAFHDSGPGVPAKLLARIFEPFFTTKPQGKGTGLGLSISNEIVHQHGGRIRAENDAERGAWFFVELPLARPRP